MPDSPLTLRCGLTLPNRFALAPLTNIQSQPDGTLGEDELRWLRRRAEGGFGLVSTCAAFVSDEGHAWRGQLGIASDEHLPGLTRLASAVSQAGAAPVIQLHHGGDKADQAPVKLSTTDGDGVRGATGADLERVIDDFVAAARRAEAAGFAGAEVHGANGYLFTQFLAPLDNPRADEFGGSLANRARLLRRCVRAVRSAVSPTFAVGVRLSPVDTWARRGLVVQDGVQVAEWMGEDGVDWVHLSLGDASGGPPHEASEVPVARAIRDRLAPEVALLAAGGIADRASAERAFAAGIDVAVVGKAAIVDPDWPRASRSPGYVTPPRPWSREHLRSVAVGEAFLGYLSRFAGLVEGGEPARS